MPSDATGESREAALAFIDHYFAVVTYAIRTGDTAAVAELATETCQSCQALIANVDRIYDNGGSADSQGWIVIDKQFIGKEPKGGAAVEVTVNQRPDTVIASPSASPSTSTEVTNVLLASLVRSQTGWRVRRLVILDKP